MNRFKLAQWLLLALLAVFAFGKVEAQATSGTAVGAVTDSTQSAVVGAHVTLTNSGTGDKRTATTNSTGGYQFVNVAPGTYKIDVEAAGFKHYTQINVTIQVGSSTRVDAALQVGEVTQSIEVSTESVQLETQQATVGHVVEGRAVTEMPLNGRNVLNLVALAPGVVPLQNVQSSDAATGLRGTFAGGNYMISGGIPNAGVQFVDGGTINTGYINALAFVPSQDAIQEFKVEGNNISPEYGGTENGVVAMVTKGGTNQFHGSVFEYLRNTVLNANTFFGNRAGLARPPFIQNQYGATVGGPIKSDKIFFFGSWQGVRETIGTTTTYTVPTVAQRNALTTGDFSSISTQLKDPGTFDATYTTFTPAASGKTFPGNQIPVSRIDPTSKAMLNWWAIPQTAATSNNYTANLINHPQIDQYLGRIDWEVSTKQRFFGRYLYQKVGANGAPPYGYMPNIRNNNSSAHQAVFGDDYTFNATTILNMRLAFLRWVSLQIPACAPCDIAFTGWPAATITAMNHPSTGIPLVNVTGYSANGGASQTIPIADENYALSGTVTKILGRHTLKFGGEWRRQPNNYGQTQNGSVEAFTFGSPSSGFTGNAWANYALGIPSSTIELTADFPATMQYYAGAFINDNFQMNNKLSINLGGRWEYPGFWSERHDRQTVFLPDASNSFSPPGTPLKGDVALVATAAYPGRTNQNPHWTLFSPRAGFAYSLTPRNVIRGGFGIVIAPIAILEQNAQPYNSPVNTARTIVPTSTQPVNAFHNPFPNGILEPVGRSATYNQDVIMGQTVDAALPYQPATYTMQWNISFQHDFGHQTVAEVAYVGLKGVHLQPPGGGNNHGLGLDELDPKYWVCGNDSSQPQCNGHKLNDSVANPFSGLVANNRPYIPATSSIGGKTTTYGQLLRPYPQYVNIYNPAAANFYTFYNGLQAKVQKRLGQGGNVLVSYTFANVNGTADGTTLFTGTQTGYMQDFVNVRNEVSQLTFNIPQLLTGSYVVDLPFGKGRHFLSTQGAFVDKVVGGWGLNGITTYRSGYPLVMTAQTTNILENLWVGGVIRPNFAAGCDKNSTPYSSAYDKVNQWFNTSCFTQPDNYALGNEPRVDPVVRGQGVANWDFSLFKGTSIGDRINVQFRAEVFNAFNRVQFGLPNAACCSASNQNFGKVSTQQNNPRQYQFALKTTF